MTDEEYAEQIQLVEYIKNFNIHFALLLRRYRRFRQINRIDNKDIEVITFFDMIIVQLRAICIENERYKSNYTAQILLRKVGEGTLADKIDNMLNQEFLVSCTNFTIKTAIKTLADEFICHYDNFDGEKLHALSLAQIIEKQLKNPYDKTNLDFIMKVLIDCIGEGLTIKM